MVAQQPTYAEILAKAPGDAVAGQAAYAVCASAMVSRAKVTSS